MRREYLEFTFKAEYAYDYGMPQPVARIDHAFSRLHLERLFLGRHKFYHFRVWYRDALANYVREMLLDSRSLARPSLERKRVEEIFGWIKTVGNFRRTRYRGVERTTFAAYMVGAAYNLLRIAKLCPEG